MPTCLRDPLGDQQICTWASCRKHQHSTGAWRSVFHIVRDFPSLLTLFQSQLSIVKHCTEYLLGTLSFISDCFIVLQLLKKTKALIQKSICKTKARREREALINTSSGSATQATQGMGMFCLLPRILQTTVSATRTRSGSACSNTRGTTEGQCT